MDCSLCIYIVIRLSTGHSKAGVSLICIEHWISICCYGLQMPPPPPPQRPFMPPTSSASAAPGVGMPQARLPPLQQGISFQGGPAAGPVPADWARAYR